MYVSEATAASARSAFEVAEWISPVWRGRVWKELRGCSVLLATPCPSSCVRNYDCEEAGIGRLAERVCLCCGRDGAWRNHRWCPDCGLVEQHQQVCTGGWGALHPRRAKARGKRLLGQSLHGYYEDELLDFVVSNTGGHLAGIRSDLFGQWILQESYGLQDPARSVPPVQQVPSYREVRRAIEVGRLAGFYSGADAVRAAHLKALDQDPGRT